MKDMNIENSTKNNQRTVPVIDSMILGKDRYYSLDCYKTRLNNNVLVVGTSGAGKTRSIVIPNLLQATGSYIISDPKGSLYKEYGDYLRDKGYEVRVLDFTCPEKSSHYNPFSYIRNSNDVLKTAHMIVKSSSTERGRTLEPFWEDAAELLAQSLISLMMEIYPEEERTLAAMNQLIGMFYVGENYSEAKNKLDLIMDVREKNDRNSQAAKQYRKFRIAAGKTLKSIVITINSKLGMFDTPELNKMTAYDDINVASIGRKPTALFVIVSDTDRSMDVIANMFFTQAMNELCRVADKECSDYRLPIPVRFILDDFATNVKIEEFPRMIASIRSRGISTMLMIQAESQLENCYDKDSKTIIGNCDTYVYMGGNDVETAKAVSERCDIPVKKILNMPVGTEWIFRRGEAPYFGENFDMEPFKQEMMRGGFESDAPCA